MPDDNDGGDFETLQEILRDNSPDLLCRNPIDLDARLLNGEDYRITGQRVRISPDYGFSCSNSEQINSTCFDYMVRFCCPQDEGREPKL